MAEHAFLSLKNIPAGGSACAVAQVDNDATGCATRYAVPKVNRQETLK